MVRHRIRNESYVKLCRYLLNRYDNPGRLAEMGARMAKMATPDAAAKVADMVEGAID